MSDPRDVPDRTRRWRHRPEGSTWGDFGPNDRLGRLNLIGPEQVRRGVAEVQEGRVFSLSLPLDLPGGTTLNPNRFPPVLRPSLRSGAVNFNCDMSLAVPGATDIVSDDLVVLHTQYSTQWDAFGHAGAAFDADGDGVAERVYYNGWRAEHDVAGPTETTQAGLTSLASLDGASEGTASTSNAGPVDVSHMAEHGVQGRAVLVDLEKHVGVDRTVIGMADLTDIFTADDIVLEPGDVLLLHTGFGRAVRARQRPFTSGSLDGHAVLDGADAALQDWVRTSGVAAIAADNYAVESFPPTREIQDEPALPLHELCLFRLGVHLGELWWLSDLADHLRLTGRSRCLLTAPPLRLPGATGSPLTPIATV